MTSVNGKHGVFTTDVEDLTVDVGGQVVFATVAAVGCVEDGPRGVRGFVGSQVHRDEQAFVLVGLRVDSLVRIKHGRRFFVGHGSATVAKASRQQHGQGHGRHEECPAHDGPSLGRDLKPSLGMQGAFVRSLGAGEGLS